MVASEKISPAFRSRLQLCKPSDLVRAVLLLDIPGLRWPEGAKQRLTREQRQDRARLLKGLANNPEIESLLGRHSARRVSEEPSPLGAILVEAPASAVLAIESEPLVRSVLDDQPLLPPDVTAQNTR